MSLYDSNLNETSYFFTEKGKTKCLSDYLLSEIYSSMVKYINEVNTFMTVDYVGS